MSQLTWAQDIEIISTELQGDSVMVRYTLSGPDLSRPYRVNLFGIMGQDTVALTRLSGKVGDSVAIGTHEILWDALAELGRFNGRIAFMITALPNFKFENPRKGSRFKKGEPVSFTWNGGNSHLDDLELELYQYDSRIDTLGSISQANQFTWQIPSSLKPGNGYRIKIIGTDKTGIDGFSQEFAIARNLPLKTIYAASGILVGGGALLFLLLRKKLPPPEPLPVK
ncbi:MAG: GPI anchored serine-threonine rich family protein [Bacteroidota bacterium]